MRNLKKKFIFLLFLTLNINFIFPAKKLKPQPVKHPFIFSIHTDYSQIIPIYHPKGNFRYDYNSTIDIGIGLEYRLRRFIGFEGIIYGSQSFSFKQSEYYCTSCSYKESEYHTLKLYTFNLYLSHLISAKFYLIPKKQDFMELFFRLGMNFEGWLFSYYCFYDNEEFIRNGNFLDNEKDISNAFGEYIFYQDILFPYNVGFHLGFGSRFFSKSRIFSYSPELRATFFVIPYADGSRNNHGYTGRDMVMIRNNGENNDVVKDFKFLVSFCNSFEFTFSNEEKPKRYTLILNFYPDSTDILPVDYYKLDHLVSQLKQHRIKTIVIVGHANHVFDKGKEYYLSINRAKSVQLYLIKKGVISSKNSAYKGKGSDEQIGSNKTEFGSKRNRRVEIFVYEDLK